jgi:hypothetical protein
MKDARTVLTTQWPAYLRLPKEGHLEPHCGFGRSTLKAWISGSIPRVASFVVKTEEGRLRGRRVIIAESLLRFLQEHHPDFQSNLTINHQPP